MKPSLRTALLIGAFTLLLGFLTLARGQQIHTNDFEKGNEPFWVKGQADAVFREIAHRMTDPGNAAEPAHGGRRSETIQVDAEAGSFIYYTYDLGRAPVGDDLSISLWLRANRPGMQLLARVVLPHERNPRDPEQTLSTLIRGDLYQYAGGWRRLELKNTPALLQTQQAMLRTQLNKDVNISDAYVDRVVLNLYAGPGRTEVWIDDLNAGPVADAPRAADAATPAAKSGPAAGTVAVPASRSNARRPAIIDLDRDQLTVGGKRFFFRAIRHTDTPLRVLREAGFNTIWLDVGTSPATVEDAVNLGFWVVPSLPVAGASDVAGLDGNKYLVSQQAIGKLVSRFGEQDAVLFWDLGQGGLALEQAQAVARAAQLVHAVDPNRPLAADVWDGFRPFSRSVNLLGVHRFPLMTGMEMPYYRDWLNQRRLLASPGTFTWTWIQTHLPEWYTNLVYDKPIQAGFSEPIGPLPEQIHLMAYTALASGVRGLGFWSDRFLADSHQGRDRLLAMALLNQQLQMLEPLLVTAEAPTWLETALPDVKAAVYRCERAILVTPMWLGRGAQFCPGQAAAANLGIVVPGVPASAQAWEVAPGCVRSLRVERVPGGTRVVLPEFDVTASIVFTGDNGPTGLVVYFQNQVRRMRKLAAQWAHDLAEVELEKVVKIETELEEMDKVQPAAQAATQPAAQAEKSAKPAATEAGSSTGSTAEKAKHTPPDGQKLIREAKLRLASSVKNWNNGDFQEAYLDAQRAVQPLRILMRAQWEKAAGDLDTPVASPYALSFFTLPQHWRFAEQLQQSQPEANALPNGDFEATPGRPLEAWVPQEVTLPGDGVELSAERVKERPHGGEQCLLLEIKPKQKEVPPVALERTFLALHSPTVRLEPGTLVRITGWVRIPLQIKGSADGVLFYDSAGGEPLAVRLVNATAENWRQVTLYRKVPASGTINLTLALTGIGKAYFDDLRIEPLRPGLKALAQGELPSLRSPKPPEKKKEKKPETNGFKFTNFLVPAKDQGARPEQKAP
jgi:hypothetical protein